MKKRTIALLLAALSPGLFAALALAGDAGTALKADELKAEPFRDAKTVASLASGDKVDILSKDGGWLQVKTAKGTGWVKMLSIRRGDARKGSAGSDVAGLSNLASGRAGTGRVVATTGVRGLNEEELKGAKFNESEIKLAESFTTSRAEAQQFAAKARLTPRAVDYLPEPTPSPVSPSQNPSQPGGLR